MSKVRGTSNVPIVLGIIGGVLGLPASVCSGACAAGLSSIGDPTTATTNAAGNTFMTLGLIGAIIGIFFSITAKKWPIASGIGLLVATLFSAITLVTFNMLTLIVVILLLLAAIFSFTQKKETID